MPCLELSGIDYEKVKGGIDRFASVVTGTNFTC